jgi:hypothetical protein
MPLTFTLTEGALPKGSEKAAFQKFAFATREIQQGYIAEATQIVQDFSQGRLPKERIWINVTHAVDGAWGIAGQALTNAELADAISKGQNTQ